MSKLYVLSRIVFSLLLVILFPWNANAHEFAAGDILVDHPWSMPLPPVSKNGAAYITVRNRGREKDRLVGAISPIAEAVEVHEHVHENGVMKMRRVADGLEISAGEEVAFQPGGYHLMLIGLKNPLVKGEKFAVELEFERAGKLKIMVHVEQKTGETTKSEAMNHSDHSDHSMEYMDSDASAGQAN